MAKHGRWTAPRSLLAAAGVALVVAGGCASGDPESSFAATAEVHNDLVAIFTEEFGAPPTSVTVSTSNSAGRCNGLFGSSDNEALHVRSLWSLDPDPADVEAAIGAAWTYLEEERGGAEGVRTDEEGYTSVASADTAGISFGPFEALAGTSGDGPFVQAISTVCADPATVDLASWESVVGATDS